MLKSVLVSSMILMVSSCATHQGDESYASKTSSEKLAKGLYLLENAHWDTTKSKTLSHDKARTVCPVGYTPIFERATEGLKRNDTKIIVGTVLAGVAGALVANQFFGNHSLQSNGYYLVVQCGDSGLKPEIVKKVLSGSLKTEMIVQASTSEAVSCGADNESTENWFSTGLSHYDALNYQRALSCFIAVSRADNDFETYIGMYHKLGMIYELGKGVQRDINEAMKWYAMSGSTMR